MHQPALRVRSVENPKENDFVFQPTSPAGSGHAGVNEKIAILLPAGPYRGLPTATPTKS
jgi:hypothetical protein